MFWETSNEDTTWEGLDSEHWKPTSSWWTISTFGVGEWREFVSQTLPHNSLEDKSSMALRVFIKKNNLTYAQLPKLWRETRDNILKSWENQKISDEKLIDLYLRLLDYLYIPRPCFVVVLDDPLQQALLILHLQGTISFSWIVKRMPKVMSFLKDYCQKKFKIDYEKQRGVLVKENWTDYFERVLHRAIFSPVYERINGDKLLEIINKKLSLEEWRFSFRFFEFVSDGIDIFWKEMRERIESNEYLPHNIYGWRGTKRLNLLFWDSAFCCEMLAKYKLLPKKDLSSYLRFRPLFMNVYSSLLYNGIATIVRNPVLVSHQNFRFHNLSGPAVKFKSGLGIYAIEGVLFPEKLYWSLIRKEISPLQILRIPNQERKIIALKVYGWENLLKRLPYKVLDKKILVINGKSLLHRVLEIRVSDWVGRFLEYTCPSTGKVGLLRVPHDTKETETVEGARAWTFKPALRFNEKGRLEFVDEK